jgi:repressor of nif and glnA expression
MFAKIKQAFFTDSLTIEWDKITADPLKFVLKNDLGEVCSTLETTQGYNQKYFNWRGLNDLPYGRYFLELSNTEGDQLLKLVKRV